MRVKDGRARALSGNPGRVSVGGCRNQTAPTEPDADGWVEATFEVGDEDNAHIILHDLGKGGEVIVVEPEALRRSAVAAAHAFVMINNP
ncbi:WYL domain-containing protein [Microlunatus speluncae]|uniref:WYL domain-containing protein n=1 Tax=Microlunatus speluncae TaxID=2594267 RepID=UPI003CCDC8D0